MTDADRTIHRGLWRAGDGSVVQRTVELVDDADGFPIGLVVDEAPYVDDTPAGFWPDTDPADEWDDDA